MDRKMRRFKQQLPSEEAERILHDGKYAVWAVDGDDNYPYAVPVNYVYAGNTVFIHSAPQGHKIDSIRRNPKCSMCIVDKDDIIPEEFTSYFRSVIVFGTARIIETEEDKIEVLRLLSDKYSPGIDPTAEIMRFIRTVCIIAVDIEKISGKESIELTRARNI